MNDKVIFLDIDGVLNTREYRDKFKCQFHHVYQNLKRPLVKTDLDLKEDCVARFGELIKEFDPDIVISSMWRFGAKPQWFTDLFALYGITVPPERINTLKCNEMEDLDGDRQMFIEEYLGDYPYKTHVMIDDSDFHFKTIYHPNLVLTDITFGFTDADYEKARSILLAK